MRLTHNDSLFWIILPIFRHLQRRSLHLFSWLQAFSVRIESFRMRLIWPMLDIYRVAEVPYSPLIPELWTTSLDIGIFSWPFEYFTLLRSEISCYNIRSDLTILLSVRHSFMLLSASFAKNCSQEVDRYLLATYWLHWTHRASRLCVSIFESIYDKY